MLPKGRGGTNGKLLLGDKVYLKFRSNNGLPIKIELASQSHPLPIRRVHLPDHS